MSDRHNAGGSGGGPCETGVGEHEHTGNSHALGRAELWLVGEEEGSSEEGDCQHDCW